jgi:TM2 domain-containing membrane protein YozV
MPGAGQFYNGDIGKGILLFLAFWLLVWIFIGWIFWVVAMVDAYQAAQSINLRSRL